MIMRKWMIALLLLLSISACERRTRVRLEGGNPPTFILSGSGVLGGLVIDGPQPERFRSPSDKENILWEIEPERMPGKLVEELHSVTYGVIPDGYKQTIPGHGESPPPLIPEKH